MNTEIKLNHLLFTDDVKLLAKSKNQIDFLVQPMHILSMQFGI